MKTFRRRLLITLTAVAVVLAGYTTWSNLRSFEITASVDIAAPPSEVWKVLSDGDSYPDWNPFLVSFKGKPKPGAVLNITMRGADGTDMVFDPTVLTVDPNRELRWIGKISPGLIFDGEHSFVLRETKPGHTRLTQSETFTGALVPPMQSWLTDDTLPQFRAMNSALAKRVMSQQDGETEN